MENHGFKIVDLFGGFGGNLHFKKPPKWDNNLQTRMIFHQDLLDPPKAKMIKMWANSTTFRVVHF